MHAVQDHYADPILDSMVSREVLIDNRSNSNEHTNYQVSLDIDKNRLFFADQDGLRFVDENLQIIDHWNESFPDMLWLEIPKIQESAMCGLRLIECGPSSKTGSSGDNTFEFFDDFESCSDEITLIDEPANPTRSPDVAWEGSYLCEPEDFNYGGEYISWYRGDEGTIDNGHIGYKTSADGISWTSYASNPILTDDFVHPYIVKDGDNFYMFVKNLNDGNLYLYNVTTHTSPVIMNGGNPVYTHSSTTTDWDYTIFNPAVEIIGGVWHMLLEGKASTGNFKTGYAYSNLTEMDWSAHRSSSYVIDDAGNPDLLFVSERNALLSVHGDYSGSYWKIIASYASASDDLSLAASWHQAPTSKFVIEQSSIHITDPHVMTNFSDTYPIMISYIYNQNVIYQKYCAKTLLEFYDVIAGTNDYDVTSKWNVIQSSGVSVSDDILTLYKASTPHTAILSKTYQINDGVIETRVRSPINVYGTFMWFRRATNTNGDHPRNSGQGGHGQNYGGYEHAIIVDNVNKVNTVITADALWHYYRLLANGVELAFKKFADGGFDTEQASVNYTDTGGLTSGYIGFEPWGTSEKMEIDWIRIRKYALPEPTAELGVMV